MKKISFILIPLVLIYLLFFKNKKKKMDSVQYFNDLVKFIQKKEGGLSKDLTDTASSNPAPGTGGYHTNKGITWKVYKDTLGSLATPERFLKMPNEDWLKIFIEKYYNKTKNLFDNDVLNGYVATWYWGGWAPSLLPPSKVAELVNANMTDIEKLKALVNLRKQYFDNIVKNNPSQVKFLKGWKNVADSYLSTFSSYL